MTEASRPQWDSRFYRLVSLWDLIMDVFDARKFLEVWTPVIGGHIAYLNLVAYKAAGHTEDSIIRSGPGDNFYGKVVALRDFVREHNLELSTDRADIILKKMEAGVHRSEMHQDIGDLHGRIRDELKRRMLLIMPSKYRELYSQASPLFGKEVSEKFGDSSYDIEEAGKCVALGLPTAAMFHLMRAMEAAVQVLGQRLVATVSSVNGETLPWGIIVGNIKTKIDGLPRGPDQDEWYKIHALLHAVNRGFRTKTAHPVERYGQDEAEQTFGAVKAFMQEMAERI